MLAVIGGLTKQPKAAALGGIGGRLGLGFLIIVLNIGLFANLDRLVGGELPTLLVAQALHPWLALLLWLALGCLIYSTAVGRILALGLPFAALDTGCAK